LNPTGNRLHYRKTLLRQKLGSLAVVNDERRGIFTTGKVERAALLTIEACDLARSIIKRTRVAVDGDGRSGSFFSMIMRVTRQTEPRWTK
jgi:hypothetical protein